VSVRGRIWRFGDHVDTDAIIPARYLITSDPAGLARPCMEGADVDFANRVALGDLIVAGENFGCGSSREHAPIAIQASGVACVIAAGFARIFYRNAINIGLPIVVCPTAVSAAADGSVWTIDLEAGRIRDEALGEEWAFAPFPPFMQRIVEAGGLAAYTRERIASGRVPRRKAKP
jgi:3-isopropylmalate/(R)-2-methylmalate dehydratase small subunit